MGILGHLTSPGRALSPDRMTYAEDQTSDGLPTAAPLPLWPVRPGSTRDSRVAVARGRACAWPWATRRCRIGSASAIWLRLAAEVSAAAG